MSAQTFNITLDSFYYHSPQQHGLQITAMSPAFPPAMRTSLREFMSSVDFSGEKKEERLVFCAPLQGLCKITISHDVQHYRDYFYHGTTATNTNNQADENAFTALIYALLHEKSTADSNDLPQSLPRESKTLSDISADQPAAAYTQQPLHLAKLVFLAFRPILSLGQTVSTFRIPSDGNNEPINETVADMAAFVLSVLPESLLGTVRMRFSADQDNLIGAFDCNYCFRKGDAPADFDTLNPTPLLPEEDMAGIFTALGQYIADNGLTAYRRNILPIVQNWTLACKSMGRFSPELLQVMLSSKKEIKINLQNINMQALAPFFGEMGAEWFELCATPLLNSISRSQHAPAACKAMQGNSLFNRTADSLPADGRDPFFLLFAGLCSGMSAEDKLTVFVSLYERWKDSASGIAVLQNIKTNMGLSFQPPAKPTPENVFAGMRAFERKNPDYAALVVDVAIDGYDRDKDPEWLNCIYSLYEDQITHEKALKVIELRCDDLLHAVEDRNLLAWICGACKEKADKDEAFRNDIVAILMNKKLSYEEFVRCIRLLGMQESDLPEDTKAKPLPAGVDSLEALAMLSLPKKEPELSAMQAGMLERLCTLLEKDCTWHAFCKYIPDILKKADLRPTMRIHPKIEKLLLRQLAVLSTDILSKQGGQTEYVELIINLRRDFCLCLYPVSNAAALDGNAKKIKASAVKKTFMRFIPLIPLFFVCIFATVMLFIILPLFPAESVMQTVIPAVVSVLGLILLLLQTLLLRRNTTADYILPSAVVLIAMGIIRLLF